jgi:hypothetical protein
MFKGSRAALVLAGGGLVVAWLASAADRQAIVPAATTDARSAALARAEHLASEIQSQATRLRAGLEAAPKPDASGRNPFAFDERPSRAPRANRTRVAAIATPENAFSTPPEPPPLTLSGIAEDSGPGENSAPVRIAVLEGYGDVFLARVGETIASRYQVTAIGPDAAEMKDLLTGRTIRLGLR